MMRVYHGIYKQSVAGSITQCDTMNKNRLKKWKTVVLQRLRHTISCKSTTMALTQLFKYLKFLHSFS